ncbi:MAG: glutamine amidotransferase [Oscillospiraceae bacterium]|nr:glutamine amidotransferase [Oscillospiraceae bacterium]
MQDYEIKICHLYPDILNLYGDRGNIIAMQRRLEWRGIRATVTDINVHQTFCWQDYDLFFIGGGQDFEQEILMQDIHSGKGEAIREAVEAGKVFLAICGGYQLLGNYYETWDGKRMDFIGAVDLYTKGAKDRMIGNYLFQMEDGTKVVAFENHSGRTYLGQGVKPLGTVLYGGGNNGQDGTEGARYKNVFGTYGHGSLLPKNPALCDQILSLAVEAKYPGKKLLPLNDTLEQEANQYMVDRLSK